MKETAVREPLARIAGVDARAPLFFTLNKHARPAPASFTSFAQAAPPAFPVMAQIIKILIFRSTLKCCNGATGAGRRADLRGKAACAAFFSGRIVSGYA
jgi:hypothetical protein